MTPLLWAAAGVLSISLIGMLAFTALPAARRFKRQCWSDLPLDWKLGLVVLVTLGLLGDFVFNQTRAVFIFGGFDKLLLSNRIQRRVDAGIWDHETARWAKILNTVDPLHIKRVPDDEVVDTHL